MRIDNRLNLVVQLDRPDGGRAYVHAMPIATAMFDTYYLVLSKTFAALFQQGLSVQAGPRVAAKLLKDVAQATPRERSSWWEGPDGVELGLLAEVRRLANVVAPAPEGGGWQVAPFEGAVDQGLLDEEEADEAINQLIFFTVVSTAAPRKDRETLILGACRLYDSQTTSSNCTAYAASLRTSTTAGNTGETPNKPDSPPPPNRGPVSTVAAVARSSQTA